MNKMIHDLYMKYRNITSKYRSVPDYLIVGAQKAGSTSLYDYLVQHPDASAAKHKEVHYFTNNFDKRLNWYKAYFSYARSSGLVGEATPYYLYHPLAAERIKTTLPSIKIIIVLREPVSRAISHYHHAVRHGFEELPMRDAFENDINSYKELSERVSKGERVVSHQENSYVSRGFYADQISRYFSLFDSENIMLIKSDDLFTDSVGTLRNVFSFLGLDENFVPYDISVKNPGVYRKNDDDNDAAEIMLWLNEIYEPYNKKLEDMYGVKFE